MPTRSPKLIEVLEDRRLFSVVSGFAERAFAIGMSNPTAMAFAPDGRLFVTEQGGSLRVVQNGTLVESPALTLAVRSEGERGLLGVAFDPDFATNSFLYLYYTTETPTIHNRVSRFTVVGDAIDPASELTVIDLPDLSEATNHNGGGIHFGPDGKLYVAVGENTSRDSSQSLSSLLGKMLRLNSDGTVPSDNPFVASTTGQNQAIWATGLRNPYTFAIRSDGLTHINDVGEGSFEEVNVGSAGANYGWPAIEGKRTNQTAPQGYVDPLVAYPRQGPVSGSTVAGGAFYEAPAGATTAFPSALSGQYFFADFGDGWVKTADPATGKVSAFAENLSGPLDLDVGPDGRLYSLEYHAGRVTVFDVAATDLQVGFRLDARKTEAVQNDKDRVGLTIDNLSGALAKGPVNVRLLASTDELVDDQDIVLIERTRNLKLQPGKSNAVTLNFRYPTSLDGTYILLAQIVPPDTLGDTNLTNNVVPSNAPVTVKPPVSDLMPSLLESSKSIAVGSAAERIDVNVINLGNSAFSGSVATSLVAIERTTLAEVPLGQLTKNLSIGVGKAKAVKLKVTPPAELIAGVYDLRATIEPAGKLPDPLADNNVTVGELVVS